MVILAYARTAMTKAKKGSQKDTPPEAMLAPVLKAVLKNSGIDPKLVEDVCIGNVLQPGAARAAEPAWSGSAPRNSRRRILPMFDFGSGSVRNSTTRGSL